MSQPLSQFCLLVSDFVSVSHPCLSLLHGGGIEKFARVPRLHVLREHGCLNLSLSQCLGNITFWRGGDFGALAQIRDSRKDQTARLLRLKPLYFS